MLRAFYEKTEEDTSVYFRDRKIWQCGRRYIEEQGKYPVIWLSFKDTVRARWEETLAAIKDMVAGEYERYSALAEYAGIPVVHRILYGAIAGKRAPQSFLEGSLLILSVIITECCGISPVVLVDDYDALAEGGRRYGYLDEATSFVGNFLSAGLKSNESISLAVITGKGSSSGKGILSALNNANVYSASSKQFSGHFGFTAGEAEELLSYYGYNEANEAVKHLDGCLIGGCKMLSPEQVFRLLEEHSGGIEKDALPKISADNPASRLGNVIDSYHLDNEMVVSVLQSLAKGEEQSKERNPFWYLDGNLQLEFYLSVLLYEVYGDEYEIKPSYTADDNGVPCRDSGADTWDICITGKDITWIIVASMSPDPVYQLNNDTCRCIRYLEQCRSARNYLSFVAPVIFPDTDKFYRSASILTIVDEKMKDEFEGWLYGIKAYDMLSFVNETVAGTNLEAMADRRNEVLTAIQRILSSRIT